MEHANETEIDETWCGGENDARELSDFWVGETVFGKLLVPRPGCDIVWGDRREKLKTPRPGDIWPEMWTLRSQGQRKRSLTGARSPKTSTRQGNRGISAKVDGLSMLGRYMQPKANVENNMGQWWPGRRFLQRRILNGAIESGERSLRSGGQF